MRGMLAPPSRRLRADGFEDLDCTFSRNNVSGLNHQAKSDQMEQCLGEALWSGQYPRTEIADRAFPQHRQLQSDPGSTNLERRFARRGIDNADGCHKA